MSLTLAISIALGSFIILQDYAVSAAWSRTTARKINISRQPLKTALREFASQSGLQIAYRTAVADGEMAPAVKGTMSPEEGLTRLLSGSNLRYSFSSANTVTVLDADAQTSAVSTDGSILLDPITINSRVDSAFGQTEGYIATHDATATKTDTPLIEVPQTVNVVTRDQIEAQGAQNVTEATRYSPGVVATWGGNDSRNDVLSTRGFNVRYNLNGSRLPYGAYSIAMLRIEPYGLERIDILKGPASVLYGQNLPGGLINLSSKTPTETPLREVVLQGGNHDRVQGMFDFSGPVDPEGKFLYRLTGLARDADGSVDFGYDKRQFIAPSITWKPSDATSLMFFSHYQKDDTISDYASLPAAGTLRSNPNGRFPVNRYAGEPGFDGYKREQYSLGYNFKHEFNEDWTLRQNLQLNHVEVDTTASPAYMLDPTERYINRVATRGEAAADSFTVDTSIEGKIGTGSLQHTVLGGIDYLKLDDKYRFSSGLYSGRFDLYNPVYGAPVPALFPRIDYHMKRRQLGVYVQDQIKWQNWILTAGLRNDWVQSDSVEALSSSTFSSDDSALTGRVGLTYLFDNGFAPYISYSTSFDPVDGVSPSGGPLKSMKGDQIEAGLKYQSQDRTLYATLSAFQINQQNVAAPNPTPGGTGQLQAGEARARGLELEVKAEITASLNLIGSYAYVDSEVTRVNESTRNLLGKNLVMVPRHQASIWLDHKADSGALAGLGIGGGLRYQGKSFGDAANEFEVDGHVFVDAALSIDFGQLNKKLDGLDLRVTGTNLLNKEYVSYCQGPLLCYYGQGRTINATMKYRW
ncbi:TonB-dependent siderophore receptor [Phyllobacterium sp. SB3]|uniref:TonB-dependent siderophore receptor n=1 Tax=Phyllobacterium sp. SB3 TaxID=3156073 RepID=UPI0032AF0480